MFTHGCRVHMALVLLLLLYHCDSDTIRWSCVFVSSVLYVRYGYCRFSFGGGECLVRNSHLRFVAEKSICIILYENIVLAFYSWRRWLWNSFFFSLPFVAIIGVVFVVVLLYLLRCAKVTGSTDMRFKTTIVLICCLLKISIALRIDHSAIQYKRARARTHIQAYKVRKKKREKTTAYATHIAREAVSTRQST